MALLMPVRYRTTPGQREHVIPAYEKTRSQLDAIYACQRLKLPFDGSCLSDTDGLLPIRPSQLRAVDRTMSKGGGVDETDA